LLALQTSENGEDAVLAYGVSAMQGWRISMEDAHTTVLDLIPAAKRTDADKAHPENLSFFGVFDGHGGDKVALFSGENLPSILLKQDTFKSQDYSQSLKDTFLATDRAILNGTPLEYLAASDLCGLHNLRVGNGWLMLQLYRPEIRGGSVWLHRLCVPHSRQEALRGE
jgi:hypothetical protein